MSKSERLGRDMGLLGDYDEVESQYRTFGPYQVLCATVINLPRGAGYMLILLDQSDASAPALLPVARFNDERVRRSFADFLNKFNLQMPANDIEHRLAYGAFIARKHNTRVDLVQMRIGNDNYFVPRAIIETNEWTVVAHVVPDTSGTTTEEVLVEYRVARITDTSATPEPVPVVDFVVDPYRRLAEIVFAQLGSTEYSRLPVDDEEQRKLLEHWGFVASA